MIREQKGRERMTKYQPTSICPVFAYPCIPIWAYTRYKQIASNIIDSVQL